MSRIVEGTTRAQVAARPFMDQFHQQSAEQIAQLEDRRPRRGNPAWVRGVSGNPKGRLSAKEVARRVEEMAESLASEFGGMSVLSPGERLLVTSAAKLAVLSIPRRKRSDEIAVRVANSIARSLAIVRKGRTGRRRLVRLAPR